MRFVTGWEKKTCGCRTSPSATRRRHSPPMLPCVQLIAPVRSREPFDALHLMSRFAGLGEQIAASWQSVAARPARRNG